MRRILLFKQSLSVLTLCCASTLSFAQDDNRIWEGIYTDEQASRGREIYTEACIACHGQDLGGNSNSPGLKGMSFMFLWEGRNLGEFYEKIRAEMPTDRPGQLPAQDYIDVIAYILAQNAFPSGNVELPPNPEMLAGITISAE